VATWNSQRAHTTVIHIVTKQRKQQQTGVVGQGVIHPTKS
jgi:hypothetical protein